MPRYYVSHPAECDLLFVDTETGGLNTATAPLLELAVIRTDITGTVIYDQFSAKLLPFPDDAPVEQSTLLITGFDLPVWQALADNPDHVASAFQDLAYGTIFAAHNVPFDLPMVMRFLGRYGVRSWAGPRYRVDTVGLAFPLLVRRAVPDLKLETLTSHLGIPHDGAHTAMADAEACRQLYVRLLEGCR